MLRLSKMVVALMLILSIGAHWAILQSVAWTLMIYQYSHQDNWQQALIKTFDGQHPCSLCVLIKEGKKTERQQSTVVLRVNSLESVITESFVLSVPQANHDFPEPRCLVVATRLERPPTPPPRAS
jgi:hypothetical protein